MHWMPDQVRHDGFRILDCQVNKNSVNNTLKSYIIEHTDAHLHVKFPAPCQVLSSTVLNGGFVNASHIVNLNVEKNIDGWKGSSEPSEATLTRYCRQMGWDGKTVGMMTAAKMDTFRKVSWVEQGVEVVALITAGISNARRAGDPAECRDISDADTGRGTINIIILTNARLTRAALVEAVMTVTEAKSAALQDLDVRNPITGSRATGTGTDAIAIVNGFGPAQIRYCGKHMIFGEMLATTVIQGVTASLKEEEIVG